MQWINYEQAKLMSVLHNSHRLLLMHVALVKNIFVTKNANDVVS